MLACWKGSGVCEQNRTRRLWSHHMGPSQCFPESLMLAASGGYPAPRHRCGSRTGLVLMVPLHTRGNTHVCSGRHALRCSHMSLPLLLKVCHLISLHCLWWIVPPSPTHLRFPPVGLPQAPGSQSIKAAWASEWPREEQWSCETPSGCCLRGEALGVKSHQGWMTVSTGDRTQIDTGLSLSEGYLTYL